MKADSQTLVGPGWQLRLFLTHGSLSVLSRRLDPARSHLALFEMITFHASAWGRGGAHKEPQDLSPRFRILASPLDRTSPSGMSSVPRSWGRGETRFPLGQGGWWHPLIREGTSDLGLEGRVGVSMEAREEGTALKETKAEA